MTTRGTLAALALLSTCSTGACLQAADPAAGEQLEIDCRGTPCPWTDPATGQPLLPPKTGATWESGDVGLDLSGTGLAEAELRVVFLQSISRTLDLRAGIVRDAGATLRFDLTWYAPGVGAGDTFWTRDPVALETTTFEIWEEGAAQVRRTALVPSEATAVVLRVVKESTSATTVMIGDLTLGHPAGSGL